MRTAGTGPVELVLPAVLLSAEDRLLMNLIDEQYAQLPFYGNRRMVFS